MVSYTESQRGRRKLSINGYLYHCNKIKSDRVYWMCDQHRRSNCRIHAVTDNNGKLLKTPIGEHNHLTRNVIEPKCVVKPTDYRSKEKQNGEWRETNGDETQLNDAVSMLAKQYDITPEEQLINQFIRGFTEWTKSNVALNSDDIKGKVSPTILKHETSVQKQNRVSKHVRKPKWESFYE
jgi:hypothetical protein